MLQRGVVLFAAIRLLREIRDPAKTRMKHVEDVVFANSQTKSLAEILFKLVFDAYNNFSALPSMYILI